MNAAISTRADQANMRNPDILFALADTPPSDCTDPPPCLQARTGVTPRLSCVLCALYPGLE
eukprot:6958321-Pyramimonas_sp.AAC.1